MESWGRYGFDNGPGGTTGDVPWSNITISPQFPSTGQVMAELYPQSGGRAIDGVFALDPFAVAGLLGFTGPISVDGVDGMLNKNNVVDFLLVEQYETENDDRIDLLEEVSKETISLLLTGALPGPVVVADTLGPLVDEGRIVGWAADADEQQYFADLGLTGSMPTLDGGDGLAVVFNNAGANKLDVYLEREVDYDATVDTATGATTATATVTLTNSAPSSGLPDGVIGNYTGDATGHESDPGVALLGAAGDVGVGADARRRAPPTSRWRSAPRPAGRPGRRSSSCRRASRSRSSTSWPAPCHSTTATRSPCVPQPMVIDEQLSVSVVDTDGRPLVGVDGPSTQTRVLGE